MVVGKTYEEMRQIIAALRPERLPEFDAIQREILRLEASINCQTIPADQDLTLSYKTKENT